MPGWSCRRRASRSERVSRLPFASWNRLLLTQFPSRENRYCGNLPRLRLVQACHNLAGPRMGRKLYGGRRLLNLSSTKARKIARNTRGSNHPPHASTRRPTVPPKPAWSSQESSFGPKNPNASRTTENRAKTATKRLVEIEPRPEGGQNLSTTRIMPKDVTLIATRTRTRPGLSAHVEGGRTYPAITATMSTITYLSQLTCLRSTISPSPPSGGRFFAYLGILAITFIPTSCMYYGRCGRTAQSQRWRLTSDRAKREFGSICQNAVPQAFLLRSQFSPRPPKPWLSWWLGWLSGVLWWILSPGEWLS